MMGMSVNCTHIHTQEMQMHNANSIAAAKRSCAPNFQAQQIATNAEMCTKCTVQPKIRAECMVYDSDIEKTNRHYIMGKIDDVTTEKH